MIGLSLALIVYILSDISGGHVNPAVSLAMLMKGDLNSTSFLGYVVAQLLGGASAFYAYKMTKNM